MIRLIISFFIVSSLLYSGFLLSQNQSIKVSHAEDNRYKKGELIVQLDNGTIFKMKVPVTVDIDSMVKAVKQEKHVKNVVPNFLYKLQLVPNDSLLYKQWYLGKVHTYRTWNEGTGNSKVVVAVLDSGVDTTHPDLKKNFWVNTDEIIGNNIDDDHNGYIDDRQGWDFLNDNNNVSPKNDYLLEPSGDNKIGLIHGTAVAGVISAQGNNAQGISGITWNTKIMPLRVADAEGFVEGLAVVRAIDYAIANNADIINLSFGGIDTNPILDEVLLRAYNAGLVVVVSVGNQDGNGQLDLEKNPIFPACTMSDYDENILIGVASTDKNDRLASFSHYGAKCVDLMAPGVKFYTAQAMFPKFGYSSYYGGPFSGTSMSAPVVSGGAALLKSIHPNWNNIQIMKALLVTADPIEKANPSYVGKLGSGRINILSASQYNQDDIVLKPTGFSADNAFIFSPESKFRSSVHIMANDWTKSDAITVFPFEFKGGVRAVMGDVTGNGIKEIIAVPGVGGGPQLRIFDKKGYLKSQFFAYDTSFRGGLSVALVDYNFDGIYEIATFPGKGYTKPLVRIFTYRGELLRQFEFKEMSSSFGATLAVGDVDNDGNTEFVSATSIGKARVFIYDLNGNLKSSFLAYPSFYRAGIKLILGDINDDGKLEIITGTNNTGGPQIRIFKHDGTVISQFFGDSKKSRKGINIGILKLNQRDRLLVGSASGRDGFIRLVDYNGKDLRDPLVLGSDFYFGISFGMLY